jgi:hypothetical protein
VAVEIHWDNPEKTVVRMEMIGRWTWEEAYTGSKVGYEMLDSVPHRVNIIIDLRQSKGIPVNSLTHARSMIGRRHLRTGLTVFVGANDLFINLWNVFCRVYGVFARPAEFTFAKSVEDAYAIFDRLKAEPRT